VGEWMDGLMDAAHTTQGSGSCMSCRRDGSHTGRMDTS